MLIDLFPSSSSSWIDLLAGWSVTVVLGSLTLFIDLHSSDMIDIDHIWTVFHFMSVSLSKLRGTFFLLFFDFQFVNCMMFIIKHAHWHLIWSCQVSQWISFDGINWKLSTPLCSMQFLSRIDSSLEIINFNYHTTTTREAEKFWRNKVVGFREFPRERERILREFTSKDQLAESTLLQPKIVLLLTCSIFALRLVGTSATWTFFDLCGLIVELTKGRGFFTAGDEKK